MTEDQCAEDVEQGLVYEIDNKAASADEAQHRDMEAEDGIPSAQADPSPEIIAEEEKEQPRDQREEIGGEKVVGHKADKGEVFAAV